MRFGVTRQTKARQGSHLYLWRGGARSSKFRRGMVQQGQGRGCTHSLNSGEVRSGAVRFGLASHGRAGIGLILFIGGAWHGLACHGGTGWG